MRWERMKWPQIDALDRGMPVIVPLGSIEQHGHHLPLCTDTVQVDAIAERVEQALADTVLLTPTLWLGSSHHHLDFPGTLSVRPTLYTRLMQDLAVSILRAGFRRIFFLNGHGGNEVPLTQALTELADLEPRAESALLCAASWWTVGKPDAQQLGMETPSLSHACEYETSLMLALRPQLVEPDRARETPPTLPSVWLTGEKRVALFRRFAAMTRGGSLGRPTAATPDKGAALLEAVTRDVLAFIEEFRHWPLEAAGPAQ